MSILIRGMELPTKCSECNFCVNGFTDEAPVWECACEAIGIFVSPVDDHGKPFDFRPDWCPLVEVQEPHWIPVTERLPEPRVDVWCNSDLGQMVGYYDEMIETWYGRDYMELFVTAWMPLPEPFKGVTE